MATNSNNDNNKTSKASIGEDLNNNTNNSVKFSVLHDEDDEDSCSNKMNIDDETSQNNSDFNGDDIKELVLAGNDQIFSTWSKSDLVISTIAALNSKGRKALISGVLPEQFFLNISAGKKNQYLAVKKRFDVAVEQMIATEIANKNILDILDESKGIYGRRYGLKEGGLTATLVSGATLPIKVQAITTAIKSGKIKP